MSWKLFTLLVQAAGATALFSAVAVAAGIVLGLLVSGAVLSHAKPLSAAARLYVSFFRGVPLLVQLLLVYHLLPVLGLNVSSATAAIIALTLCTAAYQAENLRGAFLSVPGGLIEAAEMVGMTSWQRFARIEAPIALRLAIPALLNEAVAILHASALISVVGVIELTKTARDLAASTLEPLPLYATAGLIYLVMNTVLVQGGRYAERLYKVRAA